MITERMIKLAGISKPLYEENLTYGKVPAGTYYWTVNKQTMRNKEMSGYSLTSAGNWKRVALGFMGGREPREIKMLQNLTVFKTKKEAEAVFQDIADKLGVNINNLAVKEIKKK